MSASQHNNTSAVFFFVLALVFTVIALLMALVLGIALFHDSVEAPAKGLVTLAFLVPTFALFGHLAMQAYRDRRAMRPD